MSNFVLGDDVPNPVLPVTDNCPLTVNPVTVLNKTLYVPPVLFVLVNVLLVYVEPVTLISVGRFWYVVADNVVAVNVPLTVSPVTVLNKTVYVPPVLFLCVNVLLEYVAPVTLMSVGKF